MLLVAGKPFDFALGTGAAATSTFAAALSRSKQVLPVNTHHTRAIVGTAAEELTRTALD